MTIDRNTQVPWYTKTHTCDPCSNHWEDDWDCLCNDPCPDCGAEIEPDPGSETQVMIPLELAASRTKTLLGDYIKQVEEAQ